MMPASGKNSATAVSTVAVDDGFREGLQNHRYFIVCSGCRTKGVVAMLLNDDALTLG
jgi:hypothetical protein